MRRIAWISAILTLLVGADGLYMVATHYSPDNTYNFDLSSGGTVLVAAGLLLIITMIAFIQSRRPNRPEVKR